jgi:hypothetical protein
MKKHFGFFDVKSLEMRSSLSGLLHASAHVRQGRSRYLRCCPGVAVTTLGLPPDRARGGRDPLIRGVGTSSRPVHCGLCAGPLFHRCLYEAGVARRRGSTFGSSRGRNGN